MSRSSQFVSGLSGICYASKVPLCREFLVHPCTRVYYDIAEAVAGFITWKDFQANCRPKLLKDRRDCIVYYIESIFEWLLQ